VTWCRLVAGVGFESGALFGNAALTRETFDRVGGFATIGLSLVEDLSFARAARRAGLRVAYVARAGVSVTACASLAELVERARRTSAGGFSALLATLAIWMLSLPLLAGLAWVMHSAWLMGLLGVRYAAGLALTGTATLRAGAWRALWMVPLYDVLALLIGIVVTASPGTRHPVRWGGLEYPRRPPRV
jgi:cellulose synthase/poly-beta-1,6-N-acetylglucosamine synthase-like glycosyltransferase